MSSVISGSGLASLLTSNVAEFKFNRRNPKPDSPTTRRMLATLDPNILDSDIGRSVFNFKPPGQGAPYNPASKGLVIVFDLFMQNWRAIPAEGIELNKTIPSSPPELFWEYFKENLATMSASQKAAFMNL